MDTTQDNLYVAVLMKEMLSNLRFSRKHLTKSSMKSSREKEDKMGDHNW